MEKCIDICSLFTANQSLILTDGSDVWKCYRSLGEKVAELKAMIKACLIVLVRALDELKTAYIPMLCSSPDRLSRWMAMLINSCDKAMAWHSISACIAILLSSIAWADISSAISEVERSKITRLLDEKRKHGYIPREGDTVVYYAAGHDAALRDEETRAGVPSMWSPDTFSAFHGDGSQQDTSMLPFNGRKDVVCVCTVGRVSCYPCGMGTATGGFGRPGKSKTNIVQKGDRKNSFPFAHVVLTVSATNSNMDQFTALQKVRYEACNASGLRSFNTAVQKAVRKFQPSVETGRFALCDPNKATQVTQQVVEWLKSYEQATLPTQLSLLVPGAPQQIIPMSDIVERNSRSNMAMDDEFHRADYVSCLLLALTKTLNILCANPLYGAFLLLVDQKLFPDYYSLISNPIALRMIETNILQLKYTHASQFYAHMQLLRDNCVQYCTEKFPDMITMAESLFYTSISLCERFLSTYMEQTQKQMRGIMSQNATDITDAPMVGQTFSIAVRLLGNCSEYVIPMQKYVSCGVSQLKGRYPIGCCFSMSYEVAPSGENEGVSSENSIVSVKYLYFAHL